MSDYTVEQVLNIAEKLSDVLETKTGVVNGDVVRKMLLEYADTLSLLGLEEDGDPVAEVGLLIAARDAEPVAQGDDVCVPFEQLSELMRGLELGPASAYLSPHALYCIGRAIASQAKEATHPHSPDAADSGLVTSVMVERFKAAFAEHSTISPGYDGCIRAGLEAAAALAAQGRVDLLNGEMLQAGADALDRFVAWEPSNDEERYACIEAVWRAMRERAPTAAFTAQGQGEAHVATGTCRCGAPCRKEVLMRGGDYGWGDDASRTVLRYAPPASPAGVPDVKTEMDYEYDAEGMLDPYHSGHMDGWNDCRKARLAATQPEGE